MGDKMISNALCQINLDVAKEVCDFVYKAKPQEESVTDYFLYKLKEANKKFYYINVQQFTKKVEATNGADYELELWLVGSTMSIPLLIQAKQLYKNINYCNAINYPKNSTGQINKLIKFAKSSNPQKLPFYMFYAIPDDKTSTMCGGSACGIVESENSCCLFLSDAFEIEKMANNCKSSSSKVYKNDILAKSNPFVCLFCCPLSSHGIIDYLQGYYSSCNEMIGKVEVSSDNLPGYIKLIMNNEFNDENALANIEKFRLSNIKNIAIMKLDHNV